MQLGISEYLIMAMEENRLDFEQTGLPSSWNYTFNSDSIEIPHSPPGENVGTISLNVEVPEAALPATYEFNLSVQSLGITVNVTLNLTVNTFYQISVTETSSVDVTGQAGDTIYFQFDIKNGGNSPDTISVEGGGSMIFKIIKWVFSGLQKHCSLN